MLEQLYDPTRHYDRLGLTLSWIKAAPKYKPSLKEMVQMVKAFFIVASSTGLNRRTGPRFWPLLLKVLLTKPRAIEVVVGQSAMHTNYYNRSRSYIAALLEEIELVEKVGEATFNEQRLLPPDATVREMTSTARKPRAEAAAPAS